jgi:hypothetical protein
MAATLSRPLPLGSLAKHHQLLLAEGSIRL